MDNKPSMTGFSITEIERAILTRESQRRGLSFSATLRVIIREWNELHPVLSPAVPAPQPIEAQEQS